MIEETNIQIDEPNRWRLETPGIVAGSARHGPTIRIII